MQAHELIPYDRRAQRRIELLWQATLARGFVGPTARPTIRDSWARCLAAGLRPDLARAPMVLDEDGLAGRRQRDDWLGFARRAVDHLPGGFEQHHILTLFGADGTMLSSEGDPHALERLADINFRPGASWSEDAVGTNGPGTALATDRSVHVVGAEHFCIGWQPWHCAAVPVHDQVTGAIVGVVDISGFRDHAHPHTLDLVIALGVAIEQMLAMRDIERRFRIVQRFTELALRWPGDAIVAVDRGGTILGATGAAPAGFRPEAPAPAVLRAQLEALVANAARSHVEPTPATLRMWEDAGIDVVFHPVHDGDTGLAVGGALVLRDGPRSLRATSASANPSVSMSVGDAAPPRALVAPKVAARRSPTAPTRYSFLDLTGESPALAVACRVAAAAAANTLPVLLLGESGTGKELFAQAIHGASARRDGPFVAVNCAALPRELIESELFGYVGGAFSGARREGSAGKFELAHGGTVFLDEIGELPAAAQAALLRVLQEGEIVRVGAGTPRRVDVRVIAATNRDIARARAEGRMRDDLYYRLDVLTIALPPLRERVDDIAILARQFLGDAARAQGRAGHELAPEVLEAFRRYDWPGNVRELENLVRRLVALCPAGRIGLDALPPAIRAAAPRATARSMDARPHQDVADPERDRTVQAVRGAPTMAAAAAQLGITRSTLYRRLERWGLHHVHDVS